MCTINVHTMEGSRGGKQFQEEGSRNMYCAEDTVQREWMTDLTKVVEGEGEGSCWCDDLCYHFWPMPFVKSEPTIKFYTEQLDMRETLNIYIYFC